MAQHDSRSGSQTPLVGMSNAPALGARSTLTPPGAVDRERVEAQMRRWQDSVFDLTKSNPLIGLNRSRVAKLLVTARLSHGWRWNTSNGIRNVPSGSWP